MEHPTWEDLTDYFDKKLSPDRNAVVETHVAACDVCSESIEWLYKSTMLLRADTFVPPPRRLRVAAESLFDLRFGKSTAPAVVGSTIALSSEERGLPAPATGGTVIALPPSSDRATQERAIRPAASYWRRMVWIGGAVAALLVITFFATQPQQGPLVAAVQEQQGQVDITSPGSSFNLPFSGSTLSEGSAIATGADGSAQVVFANGAVRVVMLEESNLVYVGGVETKGAISRVALATDRAGDLEIDVQSGVTVDLQTGVALFTTTGGRYRFHYLEPKIIGVQVLRGTLTVRSERGVWDLPEGTDEILDYTQPFSTPTAEPTLPASPTVPAPTATAVPATPTALPTRLPPSATAVGALLEPPRDDDSPETESEGEEDSGGNDNPDATGDSGGAVVVSSPIPEGIPTTVPTEGESQLEAPETPEQQGDPSGSEADNSGSGSDDSGSGNDHDSEHESDHDDNSGSGSGNSGSGGGGGDHDSDDD